MIFSARLIGAASVLLAAGASVHAQPVPRRASSFRLPDLEGRMHTLKGYAGARALVLVSYGAGCPIARRSLPILRELRAHFEPLGVRFLFVASSPDQARLAEEARDFGIETPLLVDASLSVSRRLGFTRTAQTLLVSTSDWRIVYDGAIDDRLDYGVVKERPTRRYLADALEALLSGRAVPISWTEAKGCLLRP